MYFRNIESYLSGVFGLRSHHWACFHGWNYQMAFYGHAYFLALIQWKGTCNSYIFFGLFLNEIQNKGSVVSNPNLCSGLIRFANFQRFSSLFLDTSGNRINHESFFKMLGKSRLFTRGLIKTVSFAESFLQVLLKRKKKNLSAYKYRKDKLPWLLSILFLLAYYFSVIIVNFFCAFGKLIIKIQPFQFSVFSFPSSTWDQFPLLRF